MSAKFVSLISIKDLVIKNDEIFIETIYGNFIPVNGNYVVADGVFLIPSFFKKGDYDEDLHDWVTLNKDVSSFSSIETTGKPVVLKAGCSILIRQDGEPLQKDTFFVRNPLFGIRAAQLLGENMKHVKL